MREYYYLEIYRNPYIRLRWLMPMIKAAERTGKAYGTTKPIELEGWGYTLNLFPEVWPGTEELTLILRWEDEGESHTQTVRILRRESNLISGSYVYYFRCPFGYKAKNLYYIHSGFRSRRAFPHRYRLQDMSKQRREIAMGSVEKPYRKYGKEYYRGKLTPYGRRCLRYERNAERSFMACYAVVKGIKN